MPAASKAIAGFAHLDEKGRIPIAKAVRDTYGLRAGSTVAWVKVGEGLMIIPQDEHLAQVMEDATVALERAGITADELLSGLDEARAEVVTEHYRAGYFDRLRELATERGAADGGR